MLGFPEPGSFIRARVSWKVWGQRSFVAGATNGAFELAAVRPGEGPAGAPGFLWPGRQVGGLCGAPAAGKTGTLRIYDAAVFADFWRCITVGLPLSFG